MAYFDYSRPDMPNFTEGLASLGDELTRLMQQRQQKKIADDKLQFEREDAKRKFEQNKANIDYQNRIIDQRTKREALDFNMRQDAANAMKMDRARKAASPQEAQAILAGTVVYDPDTGKELGRGKLTPGETPDVGPAPKTPQRPPMPPEIAARFRGQGPPPSPEADALVGPIPSEADARRAEVQRMGPAALTMDAPEVEARLAAVEEERQADEIKRRRYEAQVQAWRESAPEIGPTEVDAEYNQDLGKFQADEKQFPARQAAFASEQRRAEARRPYTMSAPGQPDVTFDFETQRYAANKEAADRFLDTVSQMPLKPTDVEAAKVAHGAILAGQDPQKVFTQFQNERLLGIKQDYAATEGGLNRQNKLDVQELRNQAPRPSISIGERRLNFEGKKEESKNLRQDLKTFAERYHAKTIQEDNLQLPRIVNDLSSGQAQRQRNAMVQLWQMAQNDHRFSDKDAVMAQTVDPSWLAQIENFLSLKTSGSLDEDVKKTAIDTAKSFGAYLNSKTVKMRKFAQQDFIDSGIYDQHEADVLLSQQIPGWQRVTESKPKKVRRGPPETNRKPADPLDEAMR